MIELPAISLWQPWATLVAICAKRVETRHWALRFDSLFVVHAARRWNRDLERLCYEEPFYSHLKTLKTAATFGESLPRGSLLCTCESAKPVMCYGGGAKAILADGTSVNGDEFFFGDYSVGRFASRLGQISRLPKPVPYKGLQGRFKVKLTGEQLPKHLAWMAA